MLPKELLEVRRVKGKIYPKFAGEKDYELARKIISIFRAGTGKKYGKVLAAIRKLENAENFRKVRGFVRVLENRYVKKSCTSELDPLKVRMFLFERGFITTKKERDRIIEYAARYFNTTPEKIEEAIYADRDEEQIIEEVSEVSPEELVKLYNLSLLQTTIFNCLRLTFWTSSNHKEIFRTIKWLGLMYDLYEENGMLVTEVTGAASMLKMTRRYGVSMAKLIPYVLQSKKWWIKAEIVDENRIYHFEIDDRKGKIFPKIDEVIEYDSLLEEEFARKLKALGYDVIREPGLVKSGKYAFIPDFLVKRGKKGVYVEIVGFWTSDYLKKKVEKIKLADVPIIVVAREEYGEGKSENVILFSRRIPYAEVIKAINRYLKFETSFDGDIVRLRGRFEKVPDEYVIAGNYAIKKEIFEKIKIEVKNVKPKRLVDVRPVLQKYGLDYSILPAMGYKVMWRGLSEEDAVIIGPTK